MSLIDSYIETIKKELAEHNNDQIIQKNEELLSQKVGEISKTDSFFTLPLKNILSIVSKIDFSLVENNFECITNIIENFIKNHPNEEKEAIQFLNVFNVDSIESIDMQEIVSIFKLFPFSSLCSKLVQTYSNQQKDLDFDFEYENTRLQNQITELNEKLHKHYDTEKVFKPITSLPFFHTKDIFHAVWECNLNDVQYFIEIGKVNPNKFNKGKTPLMYAACNGNIPIIRYLVEKVGADVNLIEGKELRRAIDLAGQSGQIPAIQ